MYSLEYLPIARHDMIEIIRYIGAELKNPMAAEGLAADLIKAADSIAAHPYAYPVYTPIRPLKREYRKLLVKNYIIFYWVDEEKKTVTIARAVYAKRALSRIL